MNPREALEKAIRVLGSQRAVADAAGEDVETGHVYYWLNKAPEVPAKYCPGIEGATREKGDIVFCEALCPSTDWGAVRSQSGPAVRAPTQEEPAPSAASPREHAGEPHRRASDTNGDPFKKRNNAQADLLANAVGLRGRDSDRPKSGDRDRTTRSREGR